MTEEIKIFATPEEVSKSMGISIVTIYRYMSRKNNPLPHYKFTKRKYLIRISEFQKWIESLLVS